MHHILSRLLFLSLFTLSSASASELEWKTAFLPLYIEHAVINEGAEAVHAKPRKVTFVSRGAQPETTLAFMNTAFIPSHDTTWNKVTDANLISLCGIKLSQTATRLDDGGFKLEIIMDTSSFKVPENIRLSNELTVALIRRAITLNFPQAAITIKDGALGAGQPATEAESDLEEDGKTVQ